MLNITVGNREIDLKSNPDEQMSASIKATLFREAEIARYDGRYEDRDQIYKILMEEDEKFAGFLDANEKAEIQLTSYDQLRRVGDYHNALKGLNSISNKDVSPTTELKRLNAIGVCYSSIVSNEKKDSDDIKQLFAAWQAAYDYMQSNIDSIDPEFAVRTLEGVYGSSEAFEGFYDSALIYAELEKMRENAAQNPDFKIFAEDQTLANLAQKQLKEGDYSEAIKLSMIGADQWPDKGRYACYHYLMALTALKEGKLINDPGYSGIQQTALNGILEFVENPRNLELQPTDWKQFLIDSQTEREFLQDDFPSLKFHEHIEKI